MLKIIITVRVGSNKSFDVYVGWIPTQCKWPMHFLQDYCEVAEPAQN